MTTRKKLTSSKRKKRSIDFMAIMQMITMGLSAAIPIIELFNDPDVKITTIGGASVDEMKSSLPEGFEDNSRH